MNFTDQPHTSNGDRQVHTLDDLNALLAIRLEELEAQAAATQPVSSEVGVRIVGAFSSGKSLLLSAMLKDYVDIELHPVSSHERQTALPFRVRFGDEVQLRALGGEGEALERLEAFPERGELKNEWSELALDAPIPHLLTQAEEFAPQGGADQPISVSLIDTPGWNSGELAADQVMVATRDAPAVIFVTTARLIDSKSERAEIIEVMERLYDTMLETYKNVEEIVVIPVITYARSNPSQHRGGRSIEDRAHDFDTWLHGECESFDGYVLSKPAHLIDLVEMSEREVSEVCQAIWRNLGTSFKSDGLEFKPQEPVNSVDVLREFLRGPSVDQFEGILADLPYLEKLVERVDSGSLPLSNLNQERLIAHRARRRCEKIEEELLTYLFDTPVVSAKVRRQLQSAPQRESLNQDHPLYNWFTHVFTEEVIAVQRAWREIFERGLILSDAISRLRSEATLQDMLDQARQIILERAQECVDRFKQICIYVPTLRAIGAGAEPERGLLTLFVAYHARQQLHAALEVSPQSDSA